MRKVRIKKLPNEIMDTQFGQPRIEVNDTLKPVPREEANLEAEKNEYVVTDLEGDGIPENYRVGGKRHSHGGTPLNLPEDSFIFSDTRDLLIKDKEILKEFEMPIPKKGKSKSYTPAQIAKKYNLNKYKEILRDPMSDKLQIDTAEKMITNHTLKLGKLALVQESMKGFPQGIPAIAMPYLQSAGIDPEQILPQQTEDDGSEIERQMEEAKKGGSLAQIRKRPGMSNAGKYTGVKDFAGPHGTYPINTIERARSALRLAHNSSCPECIKRKVYAKYPSLKQAQSGYNVREIAPAYSELDDLYNQYSNYEGDEVGAWRSGVNNPMAVGNINPESSAWKKRLDRYRTNQSNLAYTPQQYDTIREMPNFGIRDKFQNWRQNRQNRKHAVPMFRASNGGNMSMAKRFPGLSIAENGGQMEYPGEEHSQMIEQDPHLSEKQRETMLLNEIYMKSQQDPNFIQNLPPELLERLLSDNNVSNQQVSPEMNYFETPMSSFEAASNVQMPYTENPFVDQQQAEEMQQARFGGLHRAQRGWWNRKSPFDRQDKTYRVEERLANQNRRRKVRDYARQFDKDYDVSKKDYELFHLNKFKKEGLQDILGTDVQIDPTLLDEILMMNPKQASKAMMFPELNKFDLSADQIRNVRDAFQTYVEGVGPYSTEKYFENMYRGNDIDPLAYNPEVLESTEEPNFADYQQQGRFANPMYKSAKARYLRDNPNQKWTDLDENDISRLVQMEADKRLPEQGDLKHTDDIKKRDIRKYLRSKNDDGDLNLDLFDEHIEDFTAYPDSWPLAGKPYEEYNFATDAGFDPNKRRKFYPNQWINDKIDNFKTKRRDKKIENQMIENAVRAQWYQGKDALEGTVNKHGGSIYQQGGTVSKDTKVYDTKEEALEAYKNANGSGTFVWKDGDKLRRIKTYKTETDVYKEKNIVDPDAFAALKKGRDAQNWKKADGTPISDDDLTLVAQHIGYVNNELNDAFNDPTFVQEFRDRFENSISNLAATGKVPSEYYDMTDQQLLDLMKRHQRQNISTLARRDLDQSTTGKAWAQQMFGKGQLGDSDYEAGELDQNKGRYSEIMGEFGYDPLLGKYTGTKGAEQFVVQEMYNILQETDPDGQYLSQVSPNFRVFTAGSANDKLHGQTFHGANVNQQRSTSDNILGNTTIGHITGAQGELYEDEEVTLEEPGDDPGIEPGDPGYDDSMEGADWWAQDVINAGAAFAQPINKYMPHYQPVDPFLPDPVFYDPSRALAANAEQAKIAADTSALYGPQGLGSRLSNIQGQGLAGAANILGDYEGKNVGIANQYENAAADILNRFALADQAGRKQFYDENTIANQQYDNARNQKRDNMRAQLVAGVTNRAQAQALNELYPNYRVDPRTGGFVDWDGSTRELGLRDYGTSGGTYQSDLDELRATGNYSTEEIKAILDNRYSNSRRSRGSRDPYLNDYYNLFESNMNRRRGWGS
tara:strand:- start:9818 stop:14176 length:4359 start_codon:yes stop_codon:yes gene_type:complete